MITGLAHTAVCVPDCDAAVTWYCDVLGLTVLSPPYRMEGDAIERDMQQLEHGLFDVHALAGVGRHDRHVRGDRQRIAHRIDLADAGKTYSPAERFAALGPPFPRELRRATRSSRPCLAPASCARSESARS